MGLIEIQLLAGDKALAFTLPGNGKPCTVAKTG
jgi:hypothetical protein